MSTVNEQVSGIWALYGGEIKALRDQGHTLQVIADKCGVSRQRIHQILVKQYGSTKGDNTFVTREAAARLLGTSPTTLRYLEKKGKVKPMQARPCARVLYDDEAMRQVSVALQERAKRREPILRVCKLCGARFYRKSYTLHPGSPGNFCSKRCAGIWAGNHYGFTAHPENKRQKYDHEGIQRLEEKGLSIPQISRRLTIPYASVYYILKEKKK